MNPLLSQVCAGAILFGLLAVASLQAQEIHVGYATQSMRRSFQEDLNARQKDALQQWLERVDQTIKKMAEAEKYALFFRTRCMSIQNTA